MTVDTLLIGTAVVAAFFSSAIALWAVRKRVKLDRDGSMIEEGYVKLAQDPEWIEMARARRVQREVMKALRELDRSQRAAVALITGLSDEQLDELGGPVQ